MSSYTPGPNKFDGLIISTGIFVCIYAGGGGGARSGTVVWGTALTVERLQFKFPVVSVEFFIYLIFPTTRRPWGRLNL